MKRVCFVCLGNICRSPMAEAIFRHLVTAAGANAQWEIDSAATSAYHIAEPPDKRSAACCRRHGVPCTGASRQITAADFTHFDFLLAMDQQNIDNLRATAPDHSSATIELVGAYDPEGVAEVADPYYGGTDGFEVNFQQLMRGLKQFLATQS